MPRLLNPVCRSCGEISPAGSSACMHCGSSFNQAASAIDLATKVAKAFGQNFDPIKASIWIIGAIALYVAIFVLPVHPVHFPMRRLVYAYLGVIMATACLVYVDAENLGTKLDIEGVPELSPLHWFLITLFLWPIGFPAYLLARAQFGQLKLVRIGLVSAGVLLVVIVLSFTVITIRNSSFYRTAASSNAKRQLKLNGQTISTPATTDKKVPVIVISSGTQVIRM